LVQFSGLSIQQIFGVRVAVDLLQHEAHNEIYGIDAVYDRYVFTFSFLWG